jgi:hypothetical protein
VLAVIAPAKFSDMQLAEHTDTAYCILAVRRSCATLSPTQ